MNGLKQLFLRIRFGMLFLLLVTASCKDDFHSDIPFVYVNFQVNLVNYNDLTVPGNAVFFNGGYGGIVVLYNGISYYAYDAACPYEADPGCRISVEGGIGTCPCCGTQYNLLDGGYLLSGTGPGTQQLKQYQVSYSANRLYITN